MTVVEKTVMYADHILSRFKAPVWFTTPSVDKMSQFNSVLALSVVLSCALLELVYTVLTHTRFNGAGLLFAPIVETPFIVLIYLFLSNKKLLFFSSYQISGDWKGSGLFSISQFLSIALALVSLFDE